MIMQADIDEVQTRKRRIKNKPHKIKAEIVNGIPRGDWRKIIGQRLAEWNKENENK